MTDVDVIIVGAGIAGISAAYHLKKLCPNTSFLILEWQHNFGGTWRLHNYPGIRSDSDLYTFGYQFKPWLGALLASGEEILRYMGEVIDEHQLLQHIRYNHRVVSASWDSPAHRWTIQGRQMAHPSDARTNPSASAPSSSGDFPAFSLTSRFLWMCQGYYDSTEGHTPQWPGLSSFRGPVIHPMAWPRDLELAGKSVLVIGSGATAATLIPAIAAEVKHVTMLQRTPTYYLIGENRQPLADELRQLQVDEAWIHEIVRRKIVHMRGPFTQRTFDQPEAVKRELLAGIRAALPEDYPDFEENFAPPYRPWQQRIAFVPNGDLFAAIRSGQASVVTGQIQRFTEAGVVVRKGQAAKEEEKAAEKQEEAGCASTSEGVEEATTGGEQVLLEADVVITATGFNISILGDVDFIIDGVALDFSQCVTLQGMMFSGMPNFIWCFGYLRSSWTLRADLISQFFCRLVNHMDATGKKSVTPTLRPEDQSLELQPWIDPHNFNPNYLLKALHRLPKKTSTHPWVHLQEYSIDQVEIPKLDLDASFFQYT